MGIHPSGTKVLNHIMDRKREREDAVEEEMNEVSNDVQKLRTTEEDDKVSSKRWTPEQDQALRQAVDEFGQRNWKVR